MINCSCELNLELCSDFSELVVLPDGGQLLLDWFDNNDSKFKDVKTRPTVLLLPGLTGKMSQGHIKLHLTC